MINPVASGFRIYVGYYLLICGVPSGHALYTTVMVVLYLARLSREAAVRGGWRAEIHTNFYDPAFPRVTGEAKFDFV